MLDTLTEREAEAVRKLRVDLWADDALDDPSDAIKRLARSLRSYHPWVHDIPTEKLGHTLAACYPTLGDMDSYILSRIAELCEAIAYTRDATTTGEK